MSSPGELVSVVISVHNAERFLGDAIRSVLDQRNVQLELIVVNDGSTDGTAAVAENFSDPRITVMHQPNQGVSSARNAGIARAQGDFIAFLDADDVWLEDKLARQLELFRADPTLGLAFTGYAITDSRLRPRAVVLEADLRRWILLEGNGQLLSSTGVARRSVLGSELRFDDALSTSADVEFAWRATQAGGSATVREPLAFYRMHDLQMHADLDQLERNMVALYDLSFDPVSDDHAHLRRRGMANLHTRLAIRDLRARDLVGARRRLRCVLRLQPSRIALMPFGAARRRVVRHLMRWLHPPMTSRQG